MLPRLVFLESRPVLVLLVEDPLQGLTVHPVTDVSDHPGLIPEGQRGGVPDEFVELCFRTGTDREPRYEAEKPVLLNHDQILSPR